MPRNKKELFDLSRKSLIVKRSKLNKNIKKKIPLGKNSNVTLQQLLCFSGSDNSNDEESESLGNSIHERNSPLPQFEEEFSLQLSHKPDELTIEEFLCRCLRHHAIKYNISRVCISSMLKELNTKFPGICTDYRTLLKTPRETVIRYVEPGNYVNFGLLKNLEIILTKEPHLEEIVIDIFVDGFAIYSDTVEKSFWIILARHKKFIFPVGLFNGSSQPASFNDLLSDFVYECKELLNLGIPFRNREIKLKIGNFLCDSPAKSHVSYTKFHIGLGCCYYCLADGYHDGSRVVYDEIGYMRRNDEDFKLQVDKNFHKGVSIIETELNVKMISQFPLDYLHCVLLGILKKMLKFLFGQIEPLLPRSIKNKVSDYLLQCNSFLPTEIRRKFRSLNDLNSFHGNELRVFLLKIGIVVLEPYVPKEFYNHFIMLHVAITILCDENLCLEKNKFSEKLLQFFIRDAVDLYGLKIATQVLHDLEHLPEIVRIQNKPLDAFSTFNFESYLIKIKKYVNTNRLPLQQIHRRLEEFLHFQDEQENEYSQAMNQDFQEDQNGSFHMVIKKGRIESFVWKSLKISCVESKDRYLLGTDKNIYVCFKICTNFEGFPVLSVRKLKNLGDFYTQPIKSSFLNIYKCETTYDGPLTTINHHEILHKMIGVPYSDKYMIFIPLKNFF